MPLTEYWRIYLADWVYEAEGTVDPLEVDRFILAVNVELRRLEAIATAAREYVRASEYAYAVAATSHPGKVVQDAAFAEVAAYETLKAAVGGADVHEPTSCAEPTPGAD